MHTTLKLTLKLERKKQTEEYFNMSLATVRLSTTGSRDGFSAKALKTSPGFQGILKVQYSHNYNRCCYARCPNPRAGREEGLQDNATHKKGSLLLTRVRAPAASNTVVRGQRAPSPSCYTNLQGEHTPLVVGLSRLVKSLQSNFIGQTHSKLSHTQDFPRGFCPVPSWQTVASFKLIGCIQVA